MSVPGSGLDTRGKNRKGPFDAEVGRGEFIIFVKVAHCCREWGRMIICSHRNAHRVILTATYGYLDGHEETASRTFLEMLVLCSRSVTGWPTNHLPNLPDKRGLTCISRTSD
jgi:hypothetical protein